MYLIEIICEYSFDDDKLMKYADSLSLIFTKFLEDSNIEVKVSAFKAFTYFLSCVSNESLL